MRIPIRAIAFGLAVAMPILADQEAPNRPYVCASPDGQLYAKSIPEKPWGSEGKTTVYLIRKGMDTAIAEFPWYARRAFLSNSGIARMGPWNRGAGPNDSDLAVAFHAFGGATRRYSTRDIEKISHGFSRSVSHYEMFSNVNGLVDVYRSGGKSYGLAFASPALSLTLEGGKTVFLDMENGKLVEMTKDMTTKRPVSE